jgi:3-oxoacyl-[acyl-carrier protein] reductase
LGEVTPTVIVTGASRGIGRGIAVSASEAGCSVVINFSSNAEAARETVDLCINSRLNESQRFVPVQEDMSDPGGITRLVDKALSEMGRIDALVNNAGVGPRVRTDITRMTRESYNEVMRVNLEGPMFLTQKVVNYWLSERPKPLLKAGFKVIFISSLSAYAVSLDRGEYCVSKAGLSMLSKLWALRLSGEGAQVFEIRPGIIETDMTRKVRDKYDVLIAQGLIPQMRWGRPEDVGVAVKAILTGAFPFSTGDVINIDGGFHIQKL